MSINTGNNYDIDVLRKLGLASDIPQVTASTNPFIPFNLYSVPTHKVIQDYQLSIQNDGSLKNYLPFFSLKKLNSIKELNNTQILEHDNFKIQFQPDGYYTEVFSKIRLYGQLNHNHLPFHSERLVDNDFFNKFDIKTDKLSEQLLHQGINNDLQFARISVPQGVNNTNILSGFYYRKYNGTYSPTIIKTTTGFANITGEIFKVVNGSYRAWTSSNTQGYDAKNYGSFYLPYPTTVDQTTYNGYAVPTKIAPALSNFPIEGTTGVKLNGLMVISTGNGVTSKICYISPHGLRSGLINTFTYSLVKQDTAGTTTYYKGVSGVICRGLTIGSEYYTGENQFPKSGIRYITSGDKPVSGAVGYTGINSGFWRLYNIDSNQHLSQTTPINQTLFYKFYSNLYTGNKTFNLGTWNGIIPANTVFQIEYITTEFNKDIGCNQPFFILYSGYGTLDAVDSKITRFLTRANVTGVTSTGEADPAYAFELTNRFHVPEKFYRASSHPTYLDDEEGFSKIGRGVGLNRNLSLMNAFINLKYQYFNAYSWLLKQYIPEVIKQNRKFKKLQKFLLRKSQGS